MKELLSLWPSRGPLYRIETMREIAERVAIAHGVTLADLKSQRQDRAVAWPRQLAMAEIHATGRFPKTQIGRFFNRDHTTVCHAIRRANGETYEDAKTPRASAEREAA